MTNLFQRSVTGLFIIIILVGSILLSGLSFFMLFLIILVTSMFEFYRMARHTRARPQKYFGVMIGAMLFIMNFLYAIGCINKKFFFVFVPLVVLIFINELYLNNNRPFTNIAFTLLGIIYVAAPLSMINYLVFSTTGELFEIQTGEGTIDVVNFIFQPERIIIYSSHILLGFFFLMWAYDTGAYIVGVPFGRHKLFKRISPKKTWEGLVGGATLSFAVSILISKFFIDLRMIDWLVIAFIIMTIGTFGDLVESMFKRSVGVKDSGRLLPGHGGLLDRFDGVFLSIPVVFSYIQFIT